MHEQRRRLMFYATMLLAILAGAYWAYRFMIDIRPHIPAARMDAEAVQLIDALKPRLKLLVHDLAEDIGPRNVFLPAKLKAAADYIHDYWQNAGFDVQIQEYKVRGIVSQNLFVGIPGRNKPGEIIVIGAHYDSVTGGSRGGNDNGSGVAALLEISRLLRGQAGDRTLRFVAFVNEEPPFFHSGDMGSMVYARQTHEKGENIVAMISLETIGYYSGMKGSQQYPFPLRFFYPETGDFLAVVGNLRSKSLVQTFAGHFMRASDFPLQCAALPSFIMGVDWSDHGSFWHYGYPAIMITDTALFRYPYYHTPEDTADKLDYDGLARVTYGIYRAIRRLAE